MSQNKIYPNHKLIFSRVLEGQCPVCKNPPDKDWIWMNYGNRQVKVCKKHLGFEDDSLGRSTVGIHVTEADLEEDES